MRLIHPADVELEDIKLEDKYINYNGEQFIIKTGWIRPLFIKQFKTLRISLKNQSELHGIFRHVDKLIEEKLQTMKQEYKTTDLIKKWTNDEGETTYYIQPKYTFANVFNERNEKIDVNKLEDKNIECRFVFALSPIKITKIPNQKKSHYGTHIKCLQIQINHIEPHDSYAESLFD